MAPAAATPKHTSTEQSSDEVWTVKGEDTYLTSGDILCGDGVVRSNNRIFAVISELNLGEKNIFVTVIFIVKNQCQ